jgi:parallel beta-helix repeat protein
MDTIRWLRLALVLAAGVLAGDPARAETQVCNVVSSLPAYISTPGHYCLEQDFDFAAIGNAVTIDVDNVVFDCNDHRITNTDHAGQYTAVYVPNEREGVTIRNCTLDNFGNTIYVQASSEPGAVANTIEGNTLLRSGSAGIWVYGSNNRIERNRVSGNTGASNGAAYGIVVYSMANNGSGNTIRDNVVSDFKPAAPGMGFHTTTQGITFSGVDDTEVTGNVVSGLYATTGQWVEGIVSQGTNNSIIARNTVLSAPALPAPLDGPQSYGIIIYGVTQGNVCRDNVVGHFSSLDVGGCVDSVNTDF